MDRSSTLIQSQSPLTLPVGQTSQRLGENKSVNRGAATPAAKPLLLEAILELALHSPLHRQYCLRDISERILGSLSLNQHRLYVLEGRPIGFVNWAWLDEATANRFASGSYNLRAHEWSCGPHLWIPELLAPYGHARQIIRDLRSNVFAKGTPARAVRVNAKGERVGLARYRA